MPDYRLNRLKGQFAVVWEEDGRRRRFRLGTSDPKEARATLREFVKERERLKRTGALTVAEIWADYVAEKEAEGKVSVGRMKDAWKALEPTFGRLAPSQAIPAVVRGYIADRRKRVGDGTIHTELGYLRAALRSHARLENGEPVSIKLPSKPRPKTRHLTPGEARNLLDAAKVPHVRLFIELAFHTAGRPSSILDLTWDRVDFRQSRISLDNPSRDRTAKGRATVPMAEEIREALEEARKAALTDHVIEWAGKPVKTIKRAIQRTADRAGLEGVTPYVLRHTAAVWMAEAGIPMSEISQYLGHTSTSVTERVYARYSPQYLRRAGGAIAAALDAGDIGCAEPKSVNANRTKGAGKGNGGEKKSQKSSG